MQFLSCAGEIEVPCDCSEDFKLAKCHMHGATAWG